jgi:hypothetical protein
MPACRSKVIAQVLATAALLSACGGGGGGGSGPPTPAPPSALSYPAQTPFTVGTAITTITPTVTGSVTSYAVAPALPAGLALNATTGAIAGTPTAITAAANYQLTASNAGGSTNATLSLTVNDVPPTLSYARANVPLATGAPMAQLVPATGGGTIVAWSIDRALPAGITFDTANGRIDGTPTSVSAVGPYVVRAENSGGAATFTLNISVINGVLLELGHGSGIVGIDVDGTRMVSVDSAGHMVLWNADTGANLASGATPCSTRCAELAAVAGNTAVFQTSTGFAVRSAADGSLVTSIAWTPPNGAWWTLATDGSYLVAGGVSGITIWSRAGAVLTTRPGSYPRSFTRAFAAPDQLRIGGGAAGANVVEYVAVPGGASTTSAAIQGTFHSWFLDGERFLTTAGTTASTYSRNATLEDIDALPTIDGLVGQGNWFSIVDGPNVRIYPVAAGTTAAATYVVGASDRVVPSGPTIGLLKFGEAQLSVVDLAGAMPVKADYPTPITSLEAFGASSAARWAFGTRHGVVLGDLVGPGAPRRFSIGGALSVAGNSQRIAVATRYDGIHYFDTATLTSQGSVDFAGSKIELSLDGTVLAAAANALEAQYSTDRTLRVFSLPGESAVADFPYTFPVDPFLADFALAGSGTRIGQVIGPTGASGTFMRTVTQLDGTPVVTDTFVGEPRNFPVRLSPDGTRSAMATGVGDPNPQTGTNLYLNGTLAGAATGWPVGWLDDSRLLVNRYRLDTGTPAFDGIAVLNATGAVISTVPTFLRQLRRMQPVTAGSIYSPEYNVVLDVANGQVIWQSALPHADALGAAAGPVIVFQSGAEIRVEPR